MWNEHLLWNGISKSRIEGRCFFSGTGITFTAPRFSDDPISVCASTINNPTTLWASTDSSNIAGASSAPRFTRDICFSSLNDNPCAESCCSTASSKKRSAAFASTIHFAKTTTLNPGHATFFHPCSGAALGADPGPRTGAGYIPSCCPVDTPFSTRDCDSTPNRVRRCLQFRQCRYL